MPQNNVIIKKGEELPVLYKTLLQQIFKEKELSKLRKFGGRIQVSITAPFNDAKKRNKNLVIDDTFIKELKDDIDNTSISLQDLTNKQLKELATKLSLPFDSKMNKNSLITEIIEIIKAPAKWKLMSK